MRPSDQMSAGGPTFCTCPRACSGDMYQGVPKICAVLGQLAAHRVGELGDAVVEDLHARRPVLAHREEEVRRLEVAVDDADARERGRGRARPGGDRGRPRRPGARRGASARCRDRARGGAPSPGTGRRALATRSASMTRTTCSLSIRTGARASARKRSTACAFDASDGCSTLSASASPVFRWRTA